MSKLDNIILIALCNTDDLKTLYTDTSDVLHPMVDEIKYLETLGLQVGDITIKGTLCSTAFDKLGGNTTCGYVDGFRLKAPLCRVCECTSAETKHSFIENRGKFRNKSNYVAHIKRLKNSNTKVNYMETCGVKSTK